MAIRAIRRQATNPGSKVGTVNEAPIYVDSDDNKLKIIPAGSGSTEVEVIDASTSQTLSNKRFIAANGTAGAPSFTFASAPTDGFHYAGSDVISLDILGVATHLWNATSYFNRSDSAAINFGAADDVTLARAAAGILNITNSVVIAPATAVPAGGTAGLGYKMSTTSNLGVFFGSGAPTLSAAQGSLYIRTDGSSTSTRLYVNTNGATTWTNFTSAV